MALTSPLKAAEIAIQSIGLGYDITLDHRLKHCKRDNSTDPRLIVIDHDEDQVRDIVLPGGMSVQNVSMSIKCECDTGEPVRFSSDVLSFHQMSEQFNQEMSLSGKIPSGQFNNMFDFSGNWQKDATNTKTLAFDGRFITFYRISLAKSQLVLHDRVRQAVPLSWDPAALARFIEKFGTHVVVGVKMGGKDVIYVKQQHSSTLQPVEVQKWLKKVADKRFQDANVVDTEVVSEKRKFGIREQLLRFVDTSPSRSYAQKEDIVSIHKRRGGSNDRNLSHAEWIHTIQHEPDVISMSFVPIISILKGVLGSGFLSHAINLYLRYKPPIEELHQFLAFQLPRQWSPVLSEIPLGLEKKQQRNTFLQFSLLGPKLYINTNPVDVRPVTGLRLYLEGKRSNRLAIHLQHLSSLPSILKVEDNLDRNFSSYPSDTRYYEKVRWKYFSHVCTAPVESDEDPSIVTGARFQVSGDGWKKVLFLQLHFSTVSNAVVVRNPEWDGSSGQVHKSGLISELLGLDFTTVSKPPSRPADVVLAGSPPVPVKMPKLLRFVDTTEMTRGPKDRPGYWVVSGARLLVENGKIALRVKYSMLTVMLPDDEVPE